MKETWKIFFTYMLVILLILVCGGVFAQDIKVIQFNADWNKANGVEWVKKLSDCDKDYIDIGVDATAQSKYKVVVIPTIIILVDGEEAKRFQADLSFKMVATKKEVQDAIDEIIMSDF